MLSHSQQFQGMHGIVDRSKDSLDWLPTINKTKNHEYRVLHDSDPLQGE